MTAQHWKSLRPSWNWPREETHIMAHVIIIIVCTYNVADLISNYFSHGLLVDMTIQRSTFKLAIEGWKFLLGPWLLLSSAVSYLLERRVHDIVRRLKMCRSTQPEELALTSRPFRSFFNHQCHQAGRYSGNRKFWFLRDCSR